MQLFLRLLFGQAGQTGSPVAGEKGVHLFLWLLKEGFICKSIKICWFLPSIRCLAGVRGRASNAGHPLPLTGLAAL